jgi:hypothetical protein
VTCMTGFEKPVTPLHRHAATLCMTIAGLRTCERPTASKWPNSLSPSGISKRDYVYDHVLATVAGTGIEPVSRTRADYVFACMQ